VNQYAQRIISTPGKQDGLAWQNDQGNWEGPIGEKMPARFEQGYTSRSEPYHGYFFKDSQRAKTRSALAKWIF